ncbi:unnamed protein product [Caenorhabditis auriculariae]|uniref:Uncharacterized protein n=1 Tax=Caenorhabditis auriculariae TaxID=2777116 RepID=A0A8S1GNG4_9PELO|nr:unnamed protein product [Caenorhabditis auriculariae]
MKTRESTSDVDKPNARAFWRLRLCPQYLRSSTARRSSDPSRAVDVKVSADLPAHQPRYIRRASKYACWEAL